MGENRAAPAEDTIPVPVSKDPNQVLKIGSQLGMKLRKELILFLKANLDVFAWEHSDMCGIPPNVIVHKLNINQKLIPVKKKDECRDLKDPRL